MTVLRSELETSRLALLRADETSDLAPDELVKF